jgi:adenylate cyclase
MHIERKVKVFFQKLAWSMVIWILAAFLFGYIRVWGVESLPAFERVLPFEPFIFPIYMITLGLAIGIPFGIMDFILDADWIKRLSYWKIILLKVIIQIVIAAFAISILVLVNNRIDASEIGIIQFVFSKTSLLWIIFTSIVSFFIYFLEVVKSKIGDRVMFNLIMGKYHNPRVENRIFMFLDMKDSTTHAENLGHIKFSSLIQDSLNDLTSAIIEHKVEVYQYVGDEAVLTWNMHNGFEHANCLQVYYTFKQTLNSRKEYYENTYGFVPFFKAGVHLGEVTVSEVGIIKREIAYHSDVLNTAARIQGKCNEFEAELLISETLKNEMENNKYYSFEHIGGISLKGKQQLVNIFQVTTT